MDLTRAPISAANFLRYVDGAYYDGGRFYRTVREDNQPADAVTIAVIQAAANRETLGEKQPFPPIPLERTRDTGLTHRDGTLSMARNGPDTATARFSSASAISPASTLEAVATRMARDSPRSAR